ncbi:MAG: hypothetical protein AAFY08_05545 [Planctomycetota bacterium]
MEAKAVTPGAFFSAIKDEYVEKDGAKKSGELVDEIDEIIEKLIKLKIIGTQHQGERLASGHPASQSIKPQEPTLASTPVWDPHKLFVIEWPDSPVQASTLEAQLSRQGFLTTATSRKRDQTIDIAVKTFEVGATIAGKFLAAGTSAYTDPRVIEADRAITRIELARELRDNYIQGTEGEDFDGEALKERLRLLNEEEAKLTLLFVKERVTTWSAVYRFSPIKAIDSKDDKGEIIKLEEAGSDQDSLKQVNESEAKQLFVLHTIKPNWDATNLNNTGVFQWITVDATGPYQPISGVPKAFSQPGGTLPGKGSEKKHELSINPVETKKYSNWSDQTVLEPKNKRDKAGFRYRLPGDAEFVYTVNSKEPVNQKTPHRWNLQIAQFGIVRALPTSMGTADSSISIGLYEDTGGLKSVSAQSTVTLVDQLDAVNSSVGAGLDQIAEIRESNAEPTELDDLNEENALLDARLKNLQNKKAIYDLQLQTLPGETE